MMISVLMLGTKMFAVRCGRIGLDSFSGCVSCADANFATTF